MSVIILGKERQKGDFILSDLFMSGSDNISKTYTQVTKKIILLRWDFTWSTSDTALVASKALKMIKNIDKPTEVLYNINI